MFCVEMVWEMELKYDEIESRWLILQGNDCFLGFVLEVVNESPSTVNVLHVLILSKSFFAVVGRMLDGVGGKIWMRTLKNTITVQLKVLNAVPLSLLRYSHIEYPVPGDRGRAKLHTLKTPKPVLHTTKAQ